MRVSQEIPAHRNTGRQRVPRQSEAEETAGWCRWQMGWRGWLLYSEDSIFYLFLPVCSFPLLSVPLCCSGGRSFASASCREDWYMFPAHTQCVQRKHNTTSCCFLQHVCSLTQQLWISQIGEWKEGENMNEQYSPLEQWLYPPATQSHNVSRVGFPGNNED